MQSEWLRRHMSKTSDTIVFQYRFVKNGSVLRSSMSIDPVLFGIFAKRMGGVEEAKEQLKRWAQSVAQSEESKVQASVSRRVHRYVYELLDDT